MSKPAKVVVIIGAGGMGAAALRRIGAGATVVLADVDAERLELVSAGARAEGHAVDSQVVDVTDAASVECLAASSAAQGPVTAVVHTAGVSPVQASIETILAVDLLGTAVVLDAFSRVVAPGGAGVFISSMAGHMATVDPTTEALLASTPTHELLRLAQVQPDRFEHGHHAYEVAKRGNHVRVQASAAAWGSRGARVNSISPGIISTPMAQTEFAGGAIVEAMNKMITTSASGRIGTPDDVAAAVAFLVGPESTFITGTDLLVDGGVIACYHEGLGL